MTFLRQLLLRPPALLYGGAVCLRNTLYDHKILKSRSFPFPVICVGNITVGGTGKTPMVEYVARLLSQKAEVAILSRGYLRRSRGFRMVSPRDTVARSGDEPLLMATHLPSVVVAVDRDRAHGISTIKKRYPATAAVILDDGYQHRSVKAGLNMILTDYNRLFTHDRIMPLGRLRENAARARKADIIVVTKTPASISAEEMNAVRAEIDPPAQQELFFTTLVYDDLRPLFVNTGDRKVTKETGVVLVTGIANASALAYFLEERAAKVIHLPFGDHHAYSIRDIYTIEEAFNGLKEKDKVIITTEKDGIRLKELTNIADHVREAFHIIPMRVRFINDEEKFIKLITAYAGKNN